jgi:aspartyl-tRNA(Asn)/glutamyl-tRNA(Gln) amidotransferase subunit A
MSLLRSARKCLSNQANYAQLNAFISRPAASSIIERAQALDNAHARDSADNEPRLSGSLIAIKDNICTADLPTTAASGILETFTSPYDATVVKRLRDAGAIIAGKTNMDEFGMGSHSTHSRFGAVKGAQRHRDMVPGERSAGGSSGGSAVAVATRQCEA